MRLALTALLLAFSAIPSMSQAEYYTPEKILQELRADLEPWARDHAGLVTLARDPYHFLELLAESPAGWRIVLHWDGEDNTGDNAQAGAFCAQRLSLGISANLGLTAKPNEALVTPTASRAALLRLVADTRDRVRGYTWPDRTTSRYLLYRRALPVVLPEGVPLAAYKLDFELIIALPPVEYRNLLG